MCRGTLNKVNQTLESAHQFTEKLNSNQGSLGLLMNDTKLYDNPITLENKLASFKTKEESWAWVDSLRMTGKQIYLIDWSDPVNGSGGTELKLIQVRPTLTNQPSF